MIIRERERKDERSLGHVSHYQELMSRVSLACRTLISN